LSNSRGLIEDFICDSFGGLFETSTFQTCSTRFVLLAGVLIVD